MSAAAPPALDDDRPAALIFRSPLFNPSETFIQAQAAALARYRPWMVGLHAKGNVEAALADRIVVARTGEAIGLALLGRAGGLARRLRPLAPALVHAHFGTDGVTALPLARALGLPLVTTLHGHDVARPRRRLLLSGRLSWMRYGLMQRRLEQEGALFLAVSDAVRARAIARGFPENRTVTHRIGIDLGRCEPGGEAEPGLILHVGRLVEKKGTADLIAAFARVRARLPGARLAIIGEGPLRPRLERLAKESGAGDAIDFPGRLPPEQVGGWMRRAWLLAAPSITARDGDAEGLPTVIVEAAAAGLPVVATRHAGIPEAVTGGETGYLVPEGDVAALADRLSILIEAPERRASMSAAARALAERDFDLARQTARLESLYDAVRRAR